MSNTFNIHRFLRLFVKHTAEHYKIYLMSVAVLIGVLMLGGGFLTYIVDEPLDIGAQTVIFAAALFLGCAIFTSTIFADYGDNKKAVSSLMLPASPLEKFLVGWVWSYLVFTVVFLASFYLVLYMVTNARHWPHHYPQLFNVFVDPAPTIFIPFTFVHAFTLFGAIHFKRLHFIKTGFVFFATVAGLILVNTFFLQGLFGRTIHPAVPFTNVSFSQGDKYFDINITQQYSGVILWLIIVVSVFLWVAAYFRLKEKQV